MVDSAGTRYGDILAAQALAAAGGATVTPGRSGYFSKPSDRLDPRLFDEHDRMLPSVRSAILSRATIFLDQRYHQVHAWAVVWLAGSGISYQWSADRDNGDLDCLIGVAWDRFLRWNPQFRGLTPAEIASVINAEFQKLDTMTDHFMGTFELTFYVNPTAADIRAINPYAAYNLTTDEWTVRPPTFSDRLPSPEAFPEEWQQSIGAEIDSANRIITRWNEARGRLSDAARPGVSVGVHTNLVTQLRQAGSAASQMFDDIHTGRHNAFGPNGHGFRDFYNYRWQMHKYAGTVQALNSIKKEEVEARKKFDLQLYGEPLEDKQSSLIKAALYEER